MTNLMIVESLNKTKKIRAILGAGWQVEASVGHIRDLPESEMGVAAPDYKPTYVVVDRRKDTVKKLAALALNADAI